MPSIVVENLSIDIPVLTTRSQSLRTLVVARAACHRWKQSLTAETRISVVAGRLDQISFQAR